MSTTATASPTGEMQRGLKNRHLQLIAIGGAIGTGLFLGSGKLISVSGPAIIFVYMVIGFFVFFIMRALGELLLSNLNYHTFGDIAKDMLGPWAGFFVSWNYWFSWVIACVADIIAITAYVQWFNPEIPNWLPALITAGVLLVLNLQPVKYFGETEFWFAILKIVAILGLIAVGVILVLTGFTSPDGTQASFANLWEHGGMFPMGASGFVLGFQMGIFSFIGVEMVGTAAAETENPRKTLPKAINSIVLRILIFYVGALAIIMSVTPWNMIDADKSPFVTTLALAGFGLAAAAIQLVVLTSAASSANGGLYSGTRMLFGLSKDGHAPKSFSLTDSRGVPKRAVFFTSVFLFAAIPLLFAGDGVVAAFTFVSSMCATMILFTWGSIVVSYIVYLKRYPERHAESKFKLPLARFAPWLVLAFFVFIAGTLLYGEDTRPPFLATPFWFVLLAILWQLRKRKLQREGRPLTAAIPLPDTQD
ncbi:D-serine/D-alanine/glycine:proton symporter (AAT family) [Leucobacter luti]|uniref:D-serine/D-alanine/glycine:proton symporter (AAT family) n=1 Tax=Leucobacter luti TaxID=340320 RepID=A0A4R6RY97_9MICO|nr:amino acid permease [Leucobacter luti]MCW2288308.1 D-serine/D-alanine/glycine transporter [Leucobacter luti]TCK45535.1 D-serine/D-alanine/glycine:proton symporter (AAT family) [Leucobacter luti]TDP91557.1 D-serine/D-alanine/glycine:proton symporter (AAT family) [Leucobacter luti]